VQKLFEHNEYAVWKEKFIDYPGSMPISMRIDSEVKGNIAEKIDQTPIDISKMLTRLNLTDNSCVDDGNSGNLSVYRIKDFTRERVTGDLLGQLFRGESYIFIYIYTPANSGVSKCISYFFQG
jgi:hypothetical protein